jgi:hypothetical protein
MPPYAQKLLALSDVRAREGVVGHLVQLSRLNDIKPTMVTPHAHPAACMPWFRGSNAARATEPYAAVPYSASKSATCEWQILDNSTVRSAMHKHRMGRLVLN